MAEMTRPSPEAVPSGAKEMTVERFDKVERAIHWINAALFAVLILTGAVLYVPGVMALIGRRRLVVDVHLIAGLLLPVPLLIGLVGRWGAALRADLRRFNRWTGDDRAWLRATIRGRHERAVARRALLDGKFNAGQKLNAAFTGGVAVVMLTSGVVMYWYRLWPLSWRTGATFTHDWTAAAIIVVVAGHISFALRDPEALRSMISGRISRKWAEAHARGWLDEISSRTTR